MKIIIFGSIIPTAAKTFKRFPLVITAAIVTNILASLYVEEKNSRIAHEVFTMMLGLPLFLAMTFYRESRGLKENWHNIGLELILGVLLLGAHFFVTGEDHSANYIIRYFHLSMIAHLVVSYVAFPWNSIEQGFWQLNKSIFIRLMHSGVVAATFNIGIAIALVAVDKLFNIKLPNTIFEHLFFFSAFIIMTWHFLAGMPETLRALEHDKNYPKSLKVFVQYLLITLVSIYMAILYVYMGKVLATGIWPQGYIGWLVSAISVLGIFNLLLLYPEAQKSEYSWIKKYSTAYYVLILPLIAMLFTAVGQRISEYGITESRYILVALGLLLTGLSIYFLVSREKMIRVIPISLTILATVTLFGPWSAYNTSRRSQLKEIRALMIKYDIQVSHTPTPKRSDVPQKVQRRLSNILDYVVKYHGFDSLTSVFSDQIIKQAEANQTKKKNNKKQSSHDSKDIMTHLGLEHSYSWDNNRTHIIYKIINHQHAPNVQGFHYAQKIHLSDYSNFSNIYIPDQKFTVVLMKDKIVFREKENTPILFVINLQDLLSGLIKDYSGKTSHTEVPTSRMQLSAKYKDLTIQLNFLRVEFDPANTESDYNITSLDAMVLIK